MAFTEKLKLEVKRAGHFCCCVCRAAGVEIHHLIPQCEGGPDTFDNAAPLCPSCHETYGANPTKKKFLTEARDFWYEVCEKKHAPQGMALSEIKNLLTDEFSDIKKILEAVSNNERIEGEKLLDEVEVVRYLLVKHKDTDTPNLEIFDTIWNDEDLPELRLQFLRRHGELFF
jgi:hypothetical protein